MSHANRFALHTLGVQAGEAIASDIPGTTSVERQQVAALFVAGLLDGVGLSLGAQAITLAALLDAICHGDRDLMIDAVDRVAEIRRTGMH